MSKSRETIIAEGLPTILRALGRWGTKTALALADAIERAESREGKRNAERGARRAFVMANPGIEPEALAVEMKRAGLYSKTTYVGDIARTIRDMRAKFHTETR